MSTLKTTNIQHPSAGSPAVELTAAGGLWLGGGKILQIVRATDSTLRSTTSTSFVDADISVTITPQKSDSVILLLALGAYRASSTTDVYNYGAVQITDSSDNAISGAETIEFGVLNFTGSGSRRFLAPLSLLAYATPATTSATTYKLRFKSPDAGTTIFLLNTTATAQLYAFEVSA